MEGEGGGGGVLSHGLSGIFSHVLWGTASPNFASSLTESFVRFDGVLACWKKSRRAHMLRGFRLSGTFGVI